MRKINMGMNRPLIGVAAIVIKDKKVLLGKRKNAHGAGTWAFPGGHLEFNESIEACAKREVFDLLTMLQGDRVGLVAWEEPAAARPRLHPLLAEFAAGEKVALVGASGGGKTTFVQILLGLYLPAKAALAQVLQQRGRNPAQPIAGQGNPLRDTIRQLSRLVARTLEQWTGIIPHAVGRLPGVFSSDWSPSAKGCKIPAAAYYALSSRH